MGKKYIPLISFIFSCFFALSQPLCDMKIYSFDDGLTHNSVTDILQAKNNIIWFGTWTGLVRFDGYDFRYFKSSPGDECDMSNIRIDNLIESSTGNIWCLTHDKKVYLFDVRKEKFVDVLQDVTGNLNEHMSMSRVYSFDSGESWIVSSSGVCFRVIDSIYSEKNAVKVYSSFAGNVKGKKIYKVLIDKDQDVWILSNKGVTIAGKKKFYNDFPFISAARCDDYMVLSSEDGHLARYDMNREKLEFVDIPYDISSVKSVMGITDSLAGICTDNGMVKYNPYKNRFDLIMLPSGHSNDLDHFRLDCYKNIWIFNKEDGVFRYDRKSEETVYLKSPETGIPQAEPNKDFVESDNYGYVWVVPNNGPLCYYDEESKELKLYYKEIGDKRILISPAIRSEVIDKEGNMWFGTKNSFGKISFFERRFKIIPNRKYENETRAVLLDKKGRMWTASKSGYIRLYDRNEKFIGYLSRNGHIKKEIASFKASIYSFFEDKDGNIWLGSRGRGIFMLKEKNSGFFSVENFIKIPEDEYSLSDNNIYTICQDKKGRIWIGTYGGGLNLVGKDKNGRIIFINSRNRLENYPMNSGFKIRHLAVTHDSVIMVATINGLITFSSDFKRPEDIKFYVNSHKKENINSLYNNDVMYLYETRDSNLYVVTQGGGFSRVISDNLLSDNIDFKTYWEPEGVPSDLNYSMIEDLQGDLWIVSKYSISRFIPGIEKIENYMGFSLREGVSFSEASIAMRPDGYIVLGSDMGCFEFCPSKLRKRNNIVPIVFTGMNIEGQKTHKSIEYYDKIELNPDQRNIIINYAALGYKDQLEIQYAYKMEGYEDDWHYVGDSRSARYIKLPGGKYKFLVKSTNSDGVWVNNVHGLNIVVLPKFWETPWAKLLYVLLFIMLILLIVYILYTIMNLKNEVKFEQEMSNIKLRFFTDISHELRTPLTLIYTPVSEILERKDISSYVRENLQTVKNNADRMLRLVNEILDFRKIQNKKMKILLEEVDIISFSGMIMNNFKLLSEEKNINFSLENNVSSAVLWIDKDKYEKILFNLLSNAFKYTHENKSITIKIKDNEKTVSVSVVDEGIGITEKKRNSLFVRFDSLVAKNMLSRSSGIGLSLVKNLVELMHGKIEVSSELGKGSEFTISFLKGKKQFSGDANVEYILNDMNLAEENTLESFDEKPEDVGDDAKLTILIVEDNVELIKVLYNILSPSYRIIEASNGKEGLKKAIEILPDIIITDVMMPVMSGLDMVKEIKANTDVCHVPILVLTAKSSMEDLKTGFEEGIDGYITKPFSSSYLKVRIENIISQRKLLQERYMDSYYEAKKQSELSPSEPQIGTYEEEFVKKVMSFMEDNMDNTTLSIDDFSDYMSMSRTVFYRKMKSIVGVTPIDFVKDIRVKRAIQLIDKGDYSFSEVTYMCGFNDPSYFGKCFKKKTGMSLREYKNRKKE